MIKCPKCGNEMEFYTKERYKGTCNAYFRAYGADAENGSMYDNAEHSYRSKFIFCAECDARVDTIDRLVDY
ncbi:MAG: hypothetical protein ACI4F0_09550 [Agathobacter sp.]